ncbi:MAG: DUF1868 domain-containing protein [Cyanobacteria bacterium P01_H01_bin.15]
MDELYQDHLNRVTRLTLPESYRNVFPSLQASAKFRNGNPAPFPGYSVITPPGDPVNAKFMSALTAFQAELTQAFPESWVMLPSSSFHITVADLIWAEDYEATVSDNPAFETQLQAAIANVFDEQANRSSNAPVIWQSLGILLRPRAIAVNLVPENSENYERVMTLRRAIYQNAHVVDLGIEQQYPYTAHLTLGYLQQPPVPDKRESLVKLLSRLCDRCLGDLPTFQMNEVQLQKFDNMTHFYRAETWPYLKF